MELSRARPFVHMMDRWACEPWSRCVEMVAPPPLGPAAGQMLPITIRSEFETALLPSTTRRVSCYLEASFSDPFLLSFLPVFLPPTSPPDQRAKDLTRFVASGFHHNLDSDPTWPVAYYCA